MDDAALTIQVLVEFRGEPCCPRCRKACAGYDARRRSWRHLDSCQYKTFLVADIPRVQCAEHGVMQIDALSQHLPNAKIAFDRFHIAQHLGDAVNAVRKDEHRELLAKGDATLAKTKFVWLQKPSKMKRSRRLLFSQLIYSTLRTARAWALKETTSKLWHYISETWSRRAWNEWIGWAKSCKLELMIRAAQMVEKHLNGIINAIVLKATNALGESMNAKIQKIKAQAYGYRNRQRFRDAIMFHLGGLDMYPKNSLTHTKP